MATIKQQARQILKDLKSSLKYNEKESKDLAIIINDLEQGQEKKHNLINVINHYRLVPYGIDHQIDILDLMEDIGELVRQLKAKQKDLQEYKQDLLNDYAIYNFYLENNKERSKGN